MVLTFLTTPRRPQAVLAQLAAVLLAGSMLGLVGAGVSAGSVAAGLTATDYGFMVSFADLAQVLAASTLAGGAGAVLGAGIGALVRNTGGAVTGTILVLLTLAAGSAPRASSYGPTGSVPERTLSVSVRVQAPHPGKRFLTWH